MEAIASKLRTRERVAALTVAGFFAYVNFQGPAAGSAFTAAREEVSQHPLCDTRMLGLLEEALTAGLHPTLIRKLAAPGSVSPVRSSVSSFPRPVATGSDTTTRARPPESVVPGASSVAQERRSGIEPDRRLRTSYRAQHNHAHAVRTRRAPHRRGTRNRPPATATGEHSRRPRSLRARSRSGGCRA